MKKLFLSPDQLIAMIDYPPLHSPGAFFGYYEKFKKGINVEPLAVVPLKEVLKHFKSKKAYSVIEKKLEKFLIKNKHARYFMLGGKHRSAAAAILKKKIPCLIIKTDEDVEKIQSMRRAKELTGILGVGKTFKATLKELEEHYFEHKRFWTMEEKVRLMIKNKDIPKK